MLRPLRDTGCTVDGGHEGLHHIFSPLAAYGSTYCCSPRKRFRCRGPHQLEEGAGDLEGQFCPISALPDECLFEILRRLDGTQERNAASGVSKRWLTILSTIRSSHSPKFSCNLVSEGDGQIVRCLDGKEATDIRLTAVTAHANGFSGLGELLIQGSNLKCVTDAGLTVVARGSPYLKTLSISNAPLVGDEGLYEIARGCSMLENLNLCKCPLISDKGLIDIAEKCPNLSTLSIENCSKLENEGLQAIGRCCQNLQSISIAGCPLVGDQGVASLVSSASSSLTKISLHSLNITDVSLAVIGHYGKMVTDLILTALHNVKERGFWVMGNTRGLQNLKFASITACHGVTDLGLEALAKGCPVLKKACLRQCWYVSDIGLRAFAGAAGSLESLQLEECNRISLVGLFSCLLNCSAKFKTLVLVKCMGVKDTNSCPVPLSLCDSLHSLSIRDCPGFGTSSLDMVTKFCPKVQNIELSGLLGLTGAGVLPLIENSESGLTKVNLSGCADVVDDDVVSALVKTHGRTLKVLSLEGCRKVTDESLLKIAVNCHVLEDLDMSRSAVTDYGVAALGSATQLRVLSLSGCTYISDSSLPFLSNLDPFLMGLNLQNCNQICESSVRSLKEEMGKCDIVS